MYKKKQFSGLEKQYQKYQEGGSVGMMMDICHKGLEIKNNLNSNSYILEIGAGSSPHLGYLNHDFKKYYFLEKSNFAIKFLKQKFKKNNKVLFKYYKNNKIPFKKNYFDRIIISCTRTYSDPENYLKQMFEFVKKKWAIVDSPTK